MSDDDIDALLDDALEDYESQETQAKKRSDEVAAQRAEAAKLLEQELSSGDNAGGPDMSQMDPEQLMKMLSQLSSLAQTQEQLENGGGGGGDQSSAGSSDEQEAKLLAMAKQLISGVAAAAGDSTERGQLDDALKQLSRVEELSKKHQELADAGNSEEADRIRVELEAISSNLQTQASTSAEQLKKAATQAGGAASAAAAAAESGDGNGNKSTADEISAEDKQKLEAFLQLMMMQQQGGGGAGASSAGMSSASSSSSATAPSPGGAAAAAPALSSADEQQMLRSYYDMIIAKFGELDGQYAAWMEGDGKKAKEDGSVAAADWKRYEEQHATIKELLKFKNRTEELFAAAAAKREKEQQNGEDGGGGSAGDENLDKLNSIVEKLGELGAPPPGFAA